MSALIQQTEEWLEFRKNKVGASDAPVIMEVSPWKTPFKLWQEKSGIISGAIENEAMRRGKELESIARDCFVRQIGIEMSPKVVVSKAKDWMIASLDGINSNGDNIVEIKCPGYDDHHFADVKKMVPEKYYPQLQHQMYVAEVDKAYYFSYVDDSNNIILEIERDQKYIDKMIKKEKQFYECLINFIAPELTHKDFLCKDDPGFEAVAKEWKEVMMLLEREKELIKREEELRKTLIKMAGDQNCKGSGITMQKITRKGNVDYSKIEALKGIDLDQYRKPATEYWKITKE